MQPATTLVHLGAISIGVHAIKTFARHFSKTHRLDIHTDGSVDVSNQQILLKSAEGMEARIVTPADRQPILEERLANYPKTRALLDGVGYNAKLELPMAASGSYFYFDSDIVWLRPVSNLRPDRAPNAFSTESWSWYNGIAKDRLWIESKTPRRVNSGFYYLGEPFPFERMEKMLIRGMFDPSIPYNTDQEIMAYLFRDMHIYHPEDLKRSRVGTIYNLNNETCAALHFPGKMWLRHLDQIEDLQITADNPTSFIRYNEPVSLSYAELIRMRLYMKIANSPVTRIYRKIRNIIHT